MNPQILSDIDKHEIGRFSVVQVAVCIQTIKFKINHKVYQVDKQNDFKFCNTFQVHRLLELII